MGTLKILIAGGGTGGHLFPGISIAEEFLGHSKCDIRFVGTQKGLEAIVIPKTGFRLYTIPVSGLYRVGLKRKIRSLLKLPVAFLKSFWILVTFRPHVVIGIGGYASGPVLILAILLGKRTVIQEQNAHPGMTNRILGKYVRLSFIPFEQSKHLFQNPVVVGNPIRKAIKDAGPKTHTHQPEKVIISIVGGSQGSHIINATIAAILPELVKTSVPIGIFHQAGKADSEWLTQEYQKYPELEATVSEFIDDMVSLYEKSHLFICRAGSMINEIIAMGKASILIPISVSSGDHQKENAKVMSEADAAIMIEEKNLTPALLHRTVNQLILNTNRLETMGLNARKLYRGDSAQKIVNAILSQFRLNLGRSPDDSGLTHN